jgi:hypothetical protein
MVIDASYDYEVWNQPVYAYTYRYFNPETGKEAKILSAAIIPRRHSRSTLGSSTVNKYNELSRAALSIDRS